MIRCPTCGSEWIQGTATCPKDGTRLNAPPGRHEPRTLMVETIDPGSLPFHVDAPALGEASAPPTTTEAPALTEPRPSGGPASARRPSELPPEPKSGGRHLPPTGIGARTTIAAPAQHRPGVATVNAFEAVAELPRPPASAPPRASAPRPAPLVQPLPVSLNPSEKNPWEDGAESTLRRVHDTPKTQVGPPDPKDPLIGTRLGEYNVISRLGQGGMGIVYRGEQPLIGKQVAIKVLRPELANDERQVRRLVDEARAVNAVHHPGLINIFSFGETPDGAKYFVMDLLEGQSCEELIHRRGRIKAWEAVPILEGALSALDAAHGAGVIHRDLKPSNIFLVDLPDHTHLVKLLDFGLAKLGADAQGGTPQTMNVVVGTPEYMAPEQARAHEISARTDLYAMGIVAYELLTGDVPFSCESAVETLMMQLDVLPKPPGELEPSIPEPLEKLIMRMLSKAPEERPASAADVKRELGRIKRQLLSAETQIAQAPKALVETVPADAPPFVPPPAAASKPPAPAPKPPAPAAPRKPSLNPADPAREPPPGSVRFDTTDVMPPVDASMLEPRPSTDVISTSTDRTGGAAAWLVPALIGAGLVGLVALAYALFFRAPPPEPVIEPPPPALEQQAPQPPPKERDDDGASNPRDPTMKRPEGSRLPRRSESPTKSRGRGKSEVVARLNGIVERAKRAPPSDVRRLIEGGAPGLRKQLDSGEQTADEVWETLDSWETQLK